MTEIITHGNKKYKTECYTCSCVFTYDIEDINEQGIVTCPDCGHVVNHYSSDYVKGSTLNGTGK